jgi:hypothetical protein
VIALEPASFEIERFELGPDACLEVQGRWFGVRGRRFMRPTLTAVAGGRPQRLLAVLDHKPWIAEEGEAWHAAFPCSTDPAALREAELTVAPDVTVPLPPPSPSTGGRRPRGGSRRSPARRRKPAGPTGEPNTGPSDDLGAGDGRLQLEHDAALRSREEALSELDAVKRDRDRLRLELGQALAARETAIAERHDVIEAEVSLRIADLRAEAESERAAAGQAAQFARERDTARAERAEAIGERNEAHAERDAAMQERNRMLAQRDTARTRAHEAAKQWEATAALGTRRTHERDAAASERDRAARERDGLVQERDRVTQERDAALKERDSALEERDRMTNERDAALQQRERDAALQQRERDAALQQREEASREQTRVLAERAVTQPELEASAGLGDATGVARAQPAERRPRRPPAPTEARPRRIAGRAEEPGSTAQSVRTREAAVMWRARLLAVSALLVALIVFIVLVTTK